MHKHSHRILLVDDDPDEGFIAERALKKVTPSCSFVYLVGSGDEAINYLAAEGKFSDRAAYPFPTIVITDLNMAGGDGFDVLEFLGANPEWFVLPRIVLSSSSDPDDIRTAYMLGASAYHSKPTTEGGMHGCMLDIVEYWARTEAPPVNTEGRLLVTKNKRLKHRYPQPQGSIKMKRVKS